MTFGFCFVTITSSGRPDGHPEAGWRSAVIYSLVVSCKRRRIDPWEYLRDIFTRIPTMTNQNIDDLLPENWKPAVKKPSVATAGTV